MNEKAILWESVESLYNWVKKEGYYGWDPYDALNSKLIQRLCMSNSYLEILIIQFNKYSPINLRPLQKIERGIDLKGTALFAQAYSKMHNVTKEERYRRKLGKSLSIIKEKSLKNKYKYECWASHYFLYTSGDKSELTADAPGTIGTCQAIIALVEGYKILKDDNLKEMTISACKFLTKGLLEEDGEDFFLKYTLTEKNRIVLNASAQGLEAMCQLLSIHEDKEMKDVCERLANFLIKKQIDDGSWFYSIYKNGKIDIQLDFHQGFIIDGLLAFLPYSKNKDELLFCIAKGAKFYNKVLFLENGQSYYRYPMRYPVDIHHQAQGLITFSKLSILDLKYLDFAKKIAEWTISNMQDESGYFYYQKYRLFTNKIPYMRWGQAWMMLAFATLLEKLEGERK